MEVFWAMVWKPFLLLPLILVMALGVWLTRMLPDSALKRLLLKRLW